MEAMALLDLLPQVHLRPEAAAKFKLARARTGTFSN